MNFLASFPEAHKDVKMDGRHKVAASLAIVILGLGILFWALIARQEKTGGAQVAAGDPSATFAQIANDVSAARALPAKVPVPPHFLDQAALTQFLVDNFNRNYLPLERETDQKLYEVLGIVKPGQSVYNILLGILQEQAVGVYDQDVNVLNLVNSFPGLQKFTYAHEYTHALQDQYFNLDALQPKLSQNDDRDLAILAVLEGDAALQQNGWAQQAGSLAPGDLERIAAYPRTQLDAAPLFMREQMTFPYIKGPPFVQYLQQTVGPSGLNAALSTAPPESTAQILHPEKYTNRVAPNLAAVTLPNLAEAWGNGWRLVRTNTLGELNLGLVQQQWSAGGGQANGWAGDQYQLLEKGNYVVLVINSLWDTPADATRFLQGFSQAMRARFPGAQVTANTATQQALFSPGVGTSNVYIAGPEKRQVVAIVSFLRPAGSV